MADDNMFRFKYKKDGRDHTAANAKMLDEVAPTNKDMHTVLVLNDAARIDAFDGAVATHHASPELHLSTSLVVDGVTYTLAAAAFQSAADDKWTHGNRGHFVSLVASPSGHFILVNDLQGNSSPELLTHDDVQTNIRSILQEELGSQHVRANYAIFRREGRPDGPDPETWRQFNRKNNCYVNATVAALAAVPELYDAAMDHFPAAAQGCVIDTIAPWSWFNLAVTVGKDTEEHVWDP